MNPRMTRWKTVPVEAGLHVGEEVVDRLGSTCAVEPMTMSPLVARFDLRHVGAGGGHGREPEEHDGCEWW